MENIVKDYLSIIKILNIFFEPSIKNYKNLIKNFPLENINIFNIALSDWNGSSKLYSNKSGSDEASIEKIFR